MDRVEDLLARLDVPEQHVPLARSLIGRAVELGGSDDEILAAAKLEDLGPLLVDLAMRPPGDTLTLDQFAERSGLDPALVHRIWSAFGLPRGGPAPLFVTPDAANAIHVIAFLADSLGVDAGVAIARVVGNATAMIAEAVSNETRVGHEVPMRDTGVPYDEIVGEMIDVIRELLPTMWDAVGAVFRRHLVNTSYQKWVPDEGRTAVVNTRAIGFVDLVGSTEVLRSQSVAELAASVDRFEQLVWDVVSSGGGRVTKLLGDEAMFVVGDAASACDIASRLVSSSPQPVRVGVTFGEIVALHGDCYGPTVNLAARLVAVAPPGEVIVDAGVRAALGENATGLEPFPTPPLRGFPEVEGAYRVLPS